MGKEDQKYGQDGNENFGGEHAVVHTEVEVEI